MRVLMTRDKSTAAAADLLQHVPDVKHTAEDGEELGVVRGQVLARHALNVLLKHQQQAVGTKLKNNSHKVSKYCAHSRPHITHKTQHQTSI